MCPTTDGIALAADRAAGWARPEGLIPAGERRAHRRPQRLSGRRVANCGHAVGLDGFASLAAITEQLADQPRIRARMRRHGLVIWLHGLMSCGAKVPFLSLCTTYAAAVRHTLPSAPCETQRGITNWGDPVGSTRAVIARISSRLRHLRSRQRVTAFLIQPSRGDTGDRRPTYHDADLPPRHGFIALLSVRAQAPCTRSTSARMARWSGCRARRRRSQPALLAPRAHWRAARDLPVYRQQSRRSRRSEAAFGGGDHRPSDAALATSEAFRARRQLWNG